MIDLVFAYPPPGFENEDDPDLIWRLDKALHGSPQAGRRWHDVLTAAIRLIGYLQCALDSCIFYLRPACIGNSFPDPEAQSSRLLLWLVLRTDDILVFCFNKEQSDNLEHEFRKTFNLINLGEVRVFCGWSSTATRRRFRTFVRRSDTSSAYHL
eukprot:g49626.t1